MQLVFYLVKIYDMVILVISFIICSRVYFIIIIVLMYNRRLS